MTTIPLSRGTALVVCVVAAAIPAILGTTVAALILLVALFMSEQRQRYALRAARSIFGLVTAITRPAEESQPIAKPKSVGAAGFEPATARV